jgi:hypothetical protein
MFKDTEIDFTYPKKIKNSTIEGEYLAEFPNINYKNHFWTAGLQIF